jgi:hypothetical protein
VEFDELLTQTVTVRTGQFTTDGLNAPNLTAMPTLYADLPCRREDRSSSQPDAWGQLVFVSTSRFFLRDPGPIPNGAILESEGRFLRLILDPQVRREVPGDIEGFIVLTGQSVQS